MDFGNNHGDIMVMQWECNGNVFFSKVTQWKQNDIYGDLTNNLGYKET